VAAVVTITGSGPEDRDEAIPPVKGYRPFREIADSLARRGIAVLRMDDRGTGGSGGNFAEATSDDFAQDIESGLAYLRTRSDIDGARLALVGHSEGGLIAPIVAARDASVRAIALMAGPGYTGRRILEFQNRYALDHNPKLTPAARDSVMRHVVPQALDSLDRSYRWMHFFLAHDPLVTARLVRQPVLILQGATDQQVTPEQADTLAAAFRAGGNRSVTVRRFADANHLFLHDPSGNPSGYTTLGDHALRRDVLGTLVDWLVAQLR
jgi:dipeptidyl aminopeptidase/acylaminoacyl peptidase